MVFNRRLKTTFKKAANVYDTARPSYPQELIKDIIKFSNLNKKSKILDIGCGTGKATILFAKKEYEITGLDISKELISIAKKNLSKYKKINFKITSFEDFIFKREYFDLIISAQAFHWLDTKVRYKKCFDLLKDNGNLALFWNYQDHNNSEFLKKVMKLYVKYCPNYDYSMGAYAEAKEISKSLKFSDLFRIKKIKFYTRNIMYSKPKYIKLVKSFSWVISSDKNNKLMLLNEIKRLLNKENFRFEIPYISLLVIAQKK